MPPAFETEEERVLTERINRAGITLDTVVRLANADTDIPEALPYVVDALRHGVRDPRLLNCLATALATRNAPADAADALIDAFVQAPGTIEYASARWAIGKALEVIAKKRHRERLAALVANRAYGIARQMVVLALGRVGDEATDAVIVRLLDDPDVCGHAATAAGKRKITAAIPGLRRLIMHNVSWIRKAAETAIRKIEQSTTL